MRPDVTIYFIRHGETEWNAEARYQGQADIPMNERGRAQAKRNGESLRPLLPGIAAAESTSPADMQAHASPFRHLILAVLSCDCMADWTAAFSDALASASLPTVK